MFAVNLYDLLTTAAALGPGQSGDGFLPADLALRRRLPRLLTGRRLRPEERRIPIGPPGRSRERLGAGFHFVGEVATGPDPSGVDRRQLEDLVSRFSQNALHFVQLVSAVSERRPRALRARGEVTVTVDGVEVFGDRVLVVVAVQGKFLFGTVGAVDVLYGRQRNKLKPDL